MATASRCPLSPHPARVEKKQQPGEKRQTPAKTAPGPPQQVRGSRDPGFVVPGLSRVVLGARGCPSTGAGGQGAVGLRKGGALRGVGGLQGQKKKAPVMSPVLATCRCQPARC